MNFEGARPHESLGALLALKRSISGMASEMIRQMALRCEGLLAARNVAGKRLFT